MNPRSLFLSVAAVIVLGATFTLSSQGLTDGVKVTLPAPVTVGDVVLDPGEYEIRRASIVTDSVLRIFSNDKLRYQTNVLTIPALGKDTPEDTKVILHHIGDKYYFDKIWMQGKDYGYEFVLPERVRALQRELAVTVPARYESATETSSTSVERTSPAAPESSSQAVSSAEQERERADALAREQQAARDREERERQAALDRERQEQQERDRVAALQREPAPAATSPADTRQDRTSAGIQDNAQKQDQLPATASGWFSYLLGGTLLIAMAGFLRKPRTQENR
jgi:flagellar biosynthesis GTPase FlhF